MSILGKNPNEENYVGGKKHWADVIKNSGPGGALVWRQPEEDFNTNSTLIVFPSEEAIFFKGGRVEKVFSEGTYKLSTENYPFISRLRNAFTGGISTFNCVVLFVRKAHSVEILWGTDSPIQVRDPVQQIATSVRAHGSYKVQIDDGVKFLSKLLGTNTVMFGQEELNLYFRNELIQYVKSSIARAISTSKSEILGICAQQDVLAKDILPILSEPFQEYGIKLVTFTIASIYIPEDDPQRQKLEEAYATKREAEIYGSDYGRFVARDILSDVANNPGAGGVAAAGAGLGLGLGAAPVFSSMAKELFTPIQPQKGEQQQAGPTGRFVQKSAANTTLTCPKCFTDNRLGANFCNQCGEELSNDLTYCKNCKHELTLQSIYCSHCGEKVKED